MESFNREIYSWIYPDLSLERIQELRDIILENKDLFLDYRYYFETRPYQISRSLRYAISYTRFLETHELSPSEKEYLSLFYPEITALTTSGYFTDSFNLLGSPEQIAYYQHLIDSYQIIGSYSQSELGNGSNLHAIETQAIYDHERQVFIINSPTITSSKFWVGGLGVSCNYTIIVARLIIDEVDYGPHPFLMQVRNLRTHRPVDGAFLGEIGPKMGLESSDKGFSRYEFVTIPKISLLNRFWDIDREGKYRKKSSPLNMLGLVHGISRVRIVKISWANLASALTIALRYSYFRTQFTSSDSPSQEVPIINYQIQQHKLFPALSRLFGIILCGKDLYELHDLCMQRLFQGDESLVDELIHTSSFYKVSITTRNVEDVEMCRRSCGGHGYMKLSGLPAIYTNILPGCTYAGDNTVIAIEFSRYVITKKPQKFWGAFVENRDTGRGFRHWINGVARFHLESFEKRYKELMGKGVPEAEIWASRMQIDAVGLIDPIFAAISYQNLEDAVGKSKFRVELEVIKDIFAINELKKYEAELRMIGMSDGEWDEMQVLLEKCYKELSPKALEYINAFMIPDEVLNSVLAKNDPYQEMMWTAKNLNPINTKNYSTTIVKLLRPKL